MTEPVLNKLCQFNVRTCINIKKLIAMDFYHGIIYTIMELGGVAMNEFEHDVQSKRNDLIDSGIGFVVAFVAFLSNFCYCYNNRRSRWLISLMKKRTYSFPIQGKECPFFHCLSC